MWIGLYCINKADLNNYKTKTPNCTVVNKILINVF